MLAQLQLDEFGRQIPRLTGTPVDVVTDIHRFLRQTLYWKCGGLTEEQLRWSPVPSGSCLLGILRHSIRAERWWMARVIGGLPPDGDERDDDDNGWILQPDDIFASVHARFEQEATRTESLIAGMTWERVVDLPVDHPMAGTTVGWIIAHMVEEVARHCGQADILREMIDGQTGE